MQFCVCLTCRCYPNQQQVNCSIRYAVCVITLVCTTYTFLLTHTHATSSAGRFCFQSLFIVNFIERRIANATNSSTPGSLDQEVLAALEVTVTKICNDIQKFLTQSASGMWPKSERQQSDDQWQRKEKKEKDVGGGAEMKRYISELVANHSFHRKSASVPKCGRSVVG